MKPAIHKTVLPSAALLFIFTFVGCAVAISPAYRITREDIRYAIENRYAVVEAEVGAGKPNAVGTRSEGHGYPIRVLNVLLAGDPLIPQSFTYDYRKTPVLRPGRYIIVLRAGPYYRAERLSFGAARFTEMRQWTQPQ